MNIDDLTIAQAREISAMFPNAAAQGQTDQRLTHSFKIGTKYLIRTVTMTYTGTVTEVTGTDVKLDQAAWVADTGRFAKALETGTLSEVEPYPDGCAVSRAAIVDFSPWNHPLPRDTK